MIVPFDMVDKSLEAIAVVDDPFNSLAVEDVTRAVTEISDSSNEKKVQYVLELI